MGCNGSDMDTAEPGEADQGGASTPDIGKDPGTDQAVDSSQPLACGQGPVGAQPLAFPGAEGFGASTPGGRGGQVLEVTNLDDSGPGSLRHALEQPGPRMIVFRVSGTIGLKSDITITNPNVTVAGQTAPGDGIAVKNYQLMNVIIDHCSISWGTDQTLSTWIGTENLTVQWTIISEALDHNNHGLAATLGGVNASYHHLLIANSPGRNPSIAGNHEHQTHNLDFRNSVIILLIIISNLAPIARKHSLLILITLAPIRPFPQPRGIFRVMCGKVTQKYPTIMQRA